MEFCPEVAVLQSAFQLVQNKAGEKLACLSKTECSDYVLILKTTVEEICQGLECDLDLQEQLLWQQNMHTLILYGLIKKTYKMEEKKNGMPVFSSLDVLVQVLPKFSKHLYFELVKDCAWEHLMVDSLPYLESSVSMQLLLDLIEHCIEEPMTAGDYKIISRIRETVIEKLLSVPYEVDSLLEKQMKPLSRPDKYIMLSSDNPDDFDILSVHERRKVSETVDFVEQDKTKDIECDKQSDAIQETVEDKSETKVSKQDAETDGAKADTCGDLEIESTGKTADDKATDKGLSFETSDLMYDRQFWNKFLCQNPIVLETLLLFTERQIENVETVTDHLHCLAHLGLFGFIKIDRSGRSNPIAAAKVPFSSGQENRIPFCWLIYNLFHKECQSGDFGRAETLPELSPIYIVDQSMADELINKISTKSWVKCVHTVLKSARDRFQRVERGSEFKLDDSNFTSDVADLSGFTESDHILDNKASDDTDNMDSYTHVVSGLYLHKDVLCRMINGCLTEVEKNGYADTDLLLKDCQDMLSQLQNTNIRYKTGGEEPDDRLEPREHIELGKCQTDAMESHVKNTIEIDSLPEESGEKTVKFGESWKLDASIEALCWRIKYRLPYCQESIEELLHPGCREFWLDERVYDAFCDNIHLLSIKERVLKLIDILRNIQSASGEITLKAQQLTCAAFTGLSFMNQDIVAMEIYTKNASLRDYLGLEDIQVMTVFNRITALRDDQILGELFLQCLCDPRDVITTAVRMSVRNKEQATNFAQILQFFPKTCQSVHPTHHPDSTLLGHVITEFLLTTALTEKEQAAFVVFLTILLQVPNNQRNTPLLSPLELMGQSILPFTGVHTLFDNGPVSCKFALTMLKTVLEHGCNKSLDWEKFEPVGLVLCFAELLQECIAFWDGGDRVSGQTKIAVKFLVLECFKILDDTTCKETMLPKGTLSVGGLYHCMAEMDLPVGMQVQEAFRLLNTNEYNHDYQEALDELLQHPGKHIANILMIASFSRDEILLSSLTEAMCKRTGQIAYDNIIGALIQVLPNMLNWEFERTIKYVMTLVEKDLLPVLYRIGNTRHLPLTGIKGCEPTLGVSQILRDVIITLGFLTDRSDMLHYVLQCYTACLKSLTGAITCKSSRPEPDLFIVSQLLLHVSDVVQLLPQQTTEPVLVLLLHLLTLYTDILDSSQNWVTRQKWRVRMVDSMTNAIQLSVDNLPDALVEKEMLLKKIMKVA